jgi:hypothetical protein
MNHLTLILGVDAMIPRNSGPNLDQFDPPRICSCHSLLAADPSADLHFLRSVRLPRFPRRSLPPFLPPSLAAARAARATTPGSSPKQPFLARLTCIANLIKLNLFIYLSIKLSPPLRPRSGVLTRPIATINEVLLYAATSSEVWCSKLNIKIDYYLF